MSQEVKNLNWYRKFVDTQVSILEAPIPKSIFLKNEQKKYSTFLQKLNLMNQKNVNSIYNKKSRIELLEQINYFITLEKIDYQSHNVDFLSSIKVDKKTFENEDYLEAFPKNWIRKVYGDATEEQIKRYETQLSKVKLAQKKYQLNLSQLKKYENLLLSLEDISSKKRIKNLKEDMVIPNDFIKQDTQLSEELHRTKLLIKRVEAKLQSKANSTQEVTQPSEQNIKKDHIPLSQIVQGLFDN